MEHRGPVIFTPVMRNISVANPGDNLVISPPNQFCQQYCTTYKTSITVSENSPLHKNTPKTIKRWYSYGKHINQSIENLGKTRERQAIEQNIPFPGTQATPAPVPGIHPLIPDPDVPATRLLKISSISGSAASCLDWIWRQKYSYIYIFVGGKRNEIFFKLENRKYVTSKSKKRVERKIYLFLIKKWQKTWKKSTTTLQKSWKILNHYYTFWFWQTQTENSQKVLGEPKYIQRQPL